jgi:uncharacterized protein YndB with AHSA1/START domain
MTGLQVSTPSDTTILITRSFNAPRALVWDALTTPDRLRKWMFAPPGWTMTTCEFEPRTGGSYRWQWKTAQADPMMTIHGVMTEVIPHEKISHTQTMAMSGCGQIGDSAITLELSESRGVTHMKLTITYSSKRDRDAALASGMEHGMEAGYKHLDVMLEQRKPV